MKVWDLCSGIGMIALGLQRSGHEIELFCEWDEPCRKVLDKHWPDVKKYHDVKNLIGELNADGRNQPGIISSGIPCQPHSRANATRSGRNDDRDLSQHVVELVEEFEPTWLIVENTQGFADLGLEPLLDDLEDRSYFSQSFSIPANVFGLPTVERHIWIVSTRDKKRLERFTENALQGIERISQQFQGGDTRIPRRWSLPKSRVCSVGERDSTRVVRNQQIGNATDPLTTQVIGDAILQTEESNNAR